MTEEDIVSLFQTLDDYLTAFEGLQSVLEQIYFVLAILLGALLSYMIVELFFGLFRRK